MNQEQSDMNPNNFNTQGNNGIPNNQPLNNQGMSFNQQPINPQPQQTPSFQQPIMQEPTPQRINNTFESSNDSNQSFQNNHHNLQQINNEYQQQVQYTQPINPKKNKLIKILAIIGGFVVGFIILFIAIFSIISVNSEKLVCKSNEGKITIMYNDKTITGYTANGMSYDLDDQKEYAEQIGIDSYIKEFTNWFKNNTSGTCTIDGNDVSTDDTENKLEDNKPDVNVVGDNKYGYITIPKNWTKFYDINGNTSLQYSYANVYIVSLNYFEDNQHTAREYASNYMYNKQNSSDVTGVTGATVQIGKNKEYTAYQVYMYYPSDGTNLITYWFEAEDGKVHYIALEGPGNLNGIKLSDYLYIAESFSLNK